MDAKQKVYELLHALQIPYRSAEHPAVFTIEQMEALQLDGANNIVKNLFVRDDKKTKFFLLVMRKEKKADLKSIRQQLGSRPLSFASENLLMEKLGLTSGAVTPLGILNDDSRCVEVVLDQDLKKLDEIGVHPNDNTATVWLRLSDLETVIQNHGNPFSYLPM